MLASNVPSQHGNSMKSKATGYEHWTKGRLVDLPNLASKGSPWWTGKGVENPKNKRTAELVTLALIIHGTLSSHLSHHIEIPCVWFCLPGETAGSYPSPYPHWVWCPGGSINIVEQNDESGYNQSLSSPSKHQKCPFFKPRLSRPHDFLSLTSRSTCSSYCTQ